METRKAIRWVIIWFTLAMAVWGGIWYYYGNIYIPKDGSVLPEGFGFSKGIEFLTCYMLEWTLSIDNLFVFLMIFRSFKVDEHRQLRALEWGIIGAVILRFLFIFLGVQLVNKFEWVLYLFGILLLWSSWKMMYGKEHETDFRHSPLIMWFRRTFSITRGFHKDHFFFYRHGKWWATPMILVVLTIESADVMFAVDSVPAAFAVTREPIIIFAANLCAIMGLRSLYFVLAHAEKSFRYLKQGVSFLLGFIGLKMMAFELIHGLEWFKYLSLGVVVGALVVSIGLSILKNRSEAAIAEK